MKTIVVRQPSVSSADAVDIEAAALERFSRNPGSWLLNEGASFVAKAALQGQQLEKCSHEERAAGLCQACSVGFMAAWLQRSVTSYHSLVTDAREKRLSPGARRALKEHPPEYYFLSLASVASATLDMAAMAVLSTKAARSPSSTSMQILQRQLAEPDVLRACAAAARLVRESVWPMLHGQQSAHPSHNSASASASTAAATTASSACTASFPAAPSAKDAEEVRKKAWCVLVAAAKAANACAVYVYGPDGGAGRASSGDSGGDSGSAGGSGVTGRGGSNSANRGGGSGVGDQEKCRTLVELCSVVEAVAGAVLEAPPCGAAGAASDPERVFADEDCAPLLLLQIVCMVPGRKITTGSLLQALTERLLSGPELTRLRWAALRRLGEVVPPAFPDGADGTPARQQCLGASPAAANGSVISAHGGGLCDNRGNNDSPTGGDDATASGGGDATAGGGGLASLCSGRAACGDGSGGGRNGSSGRDAGDVDAAPDGDSAGSEPELPPHVLRFLERGSVPKDVLYSAVLRAATVPGLSSMYQMVSPCAPSGMRRNVKSGLEAHPRRFARMAAAACRAVCLEAEAAAEAARAAADEDTQGSPHLGFVPLLGGLSSLVDAHMQTGDTRAAAAAAQGEATAQIPPAAAAAAQVSAAAARPSIGDALECHALECHALECHAWALRALVAVDGGAAWAEEVRDVASNLAAAVAPGSGFSGWSPAEKAACARRLLPTGLMRSLDCLLRRPAAAAMAAAGPAAPATVRDMERRLAASEVLQDRACVFGDVVRRMAGPMLTARIAVTAEAAEAAQVQAADLLPAPPMPPLQPASSQPQQPNATAATPETVQAASDGLRVARHTQLRRRDDGSWLHEEVGVLVTICKLARWRAAELAVGGSQARQLSQVGVTPTDLWLCDYSLAEALCGALSVIPQLLLDIGVPAPPQLPPPPQQHSPACLRPPQRADSAAAAADAAVTVLTDVAVLAARSLLPLLSQLLPLTTATLRNTDRAVNTPVKGCAVDLLFMAAPAAAAAVRSLPACEALAAAPERLLAGLHLLLRELERVCRGLHEPVDNMQDPAANVTLSFLCMLADERLAGPLAARLWGGGQVAAAGATTKARLQAQGEQTGGTGQAQRQDPTPQPGASPSAPCQEEQQRERQQQSAEATPEGPLIDADSMQRLLRRCDPAMAQLMDGIRKRVLAGKAANLPKDAYPTFRGLGQQWREWAGLQDGEGAPPWLPRLLRLCGNPGCRSFDCAAEAGLQLKQCAGCRAVRYCGTACQRQHWRGGHNVECKRLCAGTLGTGAGPGT